MSRQRVSMRKIRSVLRYHFGEGYSIRKTAKYSLLSFSTARDYVHRAKQAGLGWPLPEEMTDAELAARLFPDSRVSNPRHPAPDWEVIHKTLDRKGQTLQLAHERYLQVYPGGYSYSRFCALYRAWCKRKDVVMRQPHEPGEKLFVDYAGKRIPYVSLRSGEQCAAQIFVATLGFSSFTYVEASRDQKLPSWIGAHQRALDFFGGVPKAIICDNLKAAVSQSHRYEPTLNRTYAELGEHYKVALIPTRAYHPKDKAAVESAVGHITRQILARIDDRQFFGLEQINAAIWPLLAALNDAPFQKRLGSRRSQFEAHDLPALSPLPQDRFVLRQWKLARVNVDYHIEVNKVFYSVPYIHVHEQLEVAVSACTVECFLNGERIASHLRGARQYSYHTNPDHMPKAHRNYQDQQKLLKRVRHIGPHAEKMAEKILARFIHPEQGYRSILGLLSLARTYGQQRVDAACKHALSLGACSSKNVNAILKHWRDSPPEPEDPQPLIHENLRNGDYYAPNTE